MQRKTAPTRSGVSVSLCLCVSVSLCLLGWAGHALRFTLGRWGSRGSVVVWLYCAWQCAEYIAITGCYCDAERIK